MNWLIAIFLLTVSALAADPPKAPSPAAAPQNADPEALVIPAPTPLNGLVGGYDNNPAPALGTNQNPVAPVVPVDPEQQKADETMKRISGFMSGVAADPRMEKLKQKAVLLASDEKFLQAAQAMWTSPKRKDMFLIQIGFFVLMLIVKAWQQSRSANWFQKFLIGTVCTVVTMVGISYVIPLLVIGPPFATFTGTLWRIFVVAA